MAAIHRSSDDFEPVGSGLVIDETRVLTCSHVVHASGDELWVAFPKADPPTMDRRRVGMRVLGEPSAVVDVSVLHLEESVPVGVRPARLRCPTPEALHQERWWAFGFALSDPLGTSADGVVGEGLGYGWVRLDSDSRHLVEPGFSGGGLWCPRYEAVVGLVGHAGHGVQGRAIAFHWLDGYLPGEQIRLLAEWRPADAGDVALAAWGWRLADDPEARRHWGPRARGVAIDSDRGFRFRGRTQALREIVAWIGRAESDRTALVVTGSPGIGKSAVLGRIVTTADPELRRLLPPDDDGVMAEVGAVACAVHAKGKTALEIAKEIARAASAELPDELADAAPFLRVALDKRGSGRFNVVLDAIDEAQTPEEARLVAKEVVLPLVETCADVGARVVVGTRRRDERGDLLGVFGPAATIDLDVPAYFALDDLARYALASLQLAGNERKDNPYASNQVAEPVARRIAELANPNFLIAGLVARHHGLHDTEALRPDQIRATPSIEEALARLVDRLPTMGRVSADTALTALAFADAPGLTSPLWAVVIEALTGIAPGEEEIANFARSSAGNFLIEQGDGPNGRVYRLFHQALNEALLYRRRAIRSPAADEAAITRALLAHGRSTGWDAAPSYLLRSLSHHAERSGLLEELLAHSGYLLHADLLRLTRTIHRSTATLTQRVRLVLLTPEAAVADPPTRAALFSVTSALETLDDAIGAVPRQPYSARWATTRSRAGLGILEDPSERVGAVCAVEVDGRPLLAAGTDDGIVRLWDPAIGQAVSALECCVGEVRAVCPVEVEGQVLLAVGSDWGPLSLWDATTSQMVRPLGEAWGVRAVCAMELDGRVVVAVSDGHGALHVWDAATGRVATTLGDASGVSALCTVNVGGRVLLAVGGKGGLVRLWDAATGQTVTTLESGFDWIRSLCAVEVDGRSLLASTGGYDGIVRLFDAATGQTVSTLDGGSDWNHALCAVKVDGRTLLASGGGFDEIVRLWDAATGQIVTTLEGGGEAMCTVEVEGRTLLATGEYGGIVRLWDVATIETLNNLDDATEWFGGPCVVEVEGRARLARGGLGIVRLWDAATGQTLSELRSHTGWVGAVCAIDVEGRVRLASGAYDGIVRLWDATTGQTVATVDAHSGRPVSALCTLEVEGQVLLASGGYDGIVRLWDAATGWTVTTPAEKSSVGALCALEVDGRVMLASSSGGIVRLWDPASSHTVIIPEVDKIAVEALCPVVVDGRALLASGGYYGNLRLWDPATAQAVTTLEGHTGVVYAVCALEVDGEVLLASGGDDRTVRLWDVALSRSRLVIPVRHPVYGLTAVDGGLAVGAPDGLLVLDIQGVSSSATASPRQRGTASPVLDFFISYTGKDRAWAEWIAWELEQVGHTVVFQGWDFRPGSDFVADMERALAQAEHVLAVLSPDYVASRFAMAEWRAAFATDPDGRSQRLIPVRVADFRPHGLHLTRTYIDLVGKAEAAARAILLDGVPRVMARPAVTPRFPIRPRPNFPGCN